jgi:hypothetical protein
VDNDQEPNDTAGQASTCSLNQTITGHIGYAWQQTPYDRRDWWKFTLPEDGELSVHFDTAPSYVVASIVDATAATVLATGIIDPSNGQSTISAPRLGGGSYYLVIEQGIVDRTFGGYVCTLMLRPPEFGPDAEPSDTVAQATAAPFRQPFDGHLGYFEFYDSFKGQASDAVDWWKVDFPEGGDLKISIQTTTNLELALTLYQPDQTTVAYGTGIGPGSTNNLVARHLKPGTYWLKLSNPWYRWGA